MLVNYLHKQQITQADFAKALGVSAGYLSSLITGRKTPSITLAAKIEDLTQGDVRMSSWVRSGGDAA